MASRISVMVKALNIKGMHVDRVEYVEDTVCYDDETVSKDRIDLHSRPYKRIRCQCPKCRKCCAVYDHKAKHEVSWRANSLNGVPVYIWYQPVRIECPEHGILTEYMPWTDGNSRFTRDFNNEAAFLALTSPKTVVSQFLGINWRTVGNCIEAAHNRLEPDVTERLHGLRRICVDETSYHKGHKYITVVYDIDRNRVAWLHEGYGKSVFEIFCNALSEEEQNAIEVVAGDGARWIDDCTKKYFRKARRCIDFFHVVGWVNEALDKVRNSTRAQATRDVERMKSEFKEAEKAEKITKKEKSEELRKAREELASLPSRGRPGKRKQELLAYIHQLEKEDDEAAVGISEDEYKAAVEELARMPKRGRRSKRKAELLTIIALYEGNHEDKSRNALSAAHLKVINDLEAKVKAVKGAKYALGMNPENLNASLQDKLKLIEETHPDLFRAYQLKEKLRVILHMKDVITAEMELNQWLKEADECGIKQFEELAEKIRRHRDNILNSIELQINSSKSEATNTTVKALIATARGFRNLNNMFALIYLRCSDIVVPLHNRYQPSPEKMRDLRDLQNQRKQQREELKRASS